MNETSNYPNLQSVTHDFESRAQALNDCEYWLALAKTSTHPWNKTFLARLDNIIGKMPPHEKQELTVKFNKLIPKNAKSWKEEYDKRFLDILIEILGWDWLSNKYHGSIVKFRNRPDLQVVNDGGEVVAALECKHFWMSGEEEQYLESTRRSLENVRAREVDQRLILGDPSQNPFLWKLMCVLCKAEEQLSVIGLRDNKFIFINFDLDTSSRLQLEDTKALLERLNAVLRNRGIEFIAFQDYDVNKSLT